MRPDPDLADYKARLTRAYDDLNYGRSLSAAFMRRGHVALEAAFGPGERFERVVEVGAGAGEHLAHVRHAWGSYLMTDADDARLSLARAALPPAVAARVEVAREDARRLDLAEESADRLIACHLLEHLDRPHEVLREWHRVVRPGGVISILLPCDPGLAWRAGRMFGPRAGAERTGIAYDYWMAREHVNPIGNLIVFIRYYFADVRERWYPLGLPSTDLNLFYLCHIIRR